MSTETRTTPRVLVQTATQLGANENWTTQQFLTCDRWSYGSGPIIGNATLRQDYGLIYGPEPVAVRNLGVVPDISRTGLGSIAGNFVRICIESASGTITAQIVTLNTQGTQVTETVTYAPAWYGIVHGPTMTIDGAVSASRGGIVTWECGGLAECFDQFQLMFDYQFETSDPSYPGSGEMRRYLPAFNANGKASISAAGTTTLNGYTYSSPGVGALWTAKQILDLIIAAYVMPPGGGNPRYITCGISMQVTGDIGALAYSPIDFDASGMTILDVINYLINPHRGLTWYLDPQSSGTVNLVVTTLRQLGYSASGGITIPGSSKTGSLTISGSPWLANVSVAQDDSGTADLIRVNGDRRVDGRTFQLGSTYASHQLQKGWTAVQEANWDGRSREAGTDNVYRRFTLPDGSNADYPSSQIWQVSATLPQPVNNDEDGPVDDDATLPRQRALVFMEVASGVWEDVTDLCRISVENKPPAVLIDFGDGGITIRNQIADGLKFKVTLGVTVDRREFDQVYTRNTSNPSIPTRSGWRVRGMTISAKKELMPAGEDIAVDAGALVPSTEAIYVDETQAIRDAAALMSASLSGFLWRARWTDRGRALVALDGASYAPGHLITITDLTGCHVVVTRRSVYRDGNHWNTDIEAETIPTLPGKRL